MHNACMHYACGYTPTDLLQSVAVRMLIAARMFSVFVFSVLVGITQCHPFTVSVSTAGQYTLGADVTCKVTITNNQDSDYYLLQRNTPLDSIHSDIFSVQSNGKSVYYDGLLFQRLPPTSDEYIRVPKKSSISSKVDLSRTYSFSSSARFTVILDSIFSYYESDMSNVSFQHVSSNMETFEMVGKEVDSRLTEAENLRRNASSFIVETPSLYSSKTPAYRAPAFAGTPRGSDIAITQQVFVATYNVLDKCFSAVNTNPTLYTTWFGQRYAGYMTRVRGVYQNIKSAMNSYQFTIFFDGPECVKIQNVIAYTYKRSTVIYMCSLYRGEPDIRGSNTKLGTLLHEFTHAVAGTDDITYGQTNCRNLAQSNPNQAIQNADNYRCFTEPLSQ